MPQPSSNTGPRHSEPPWPHSPHSLHNYPQRLVRPFNPFAYCYCRKRTGKRARGILSLRWQYWQRGSGSGGPTGLCVFSPARSTQHIFPPSGEKGACRPSHCRVDRKRAPKQLWWAKCVLLFCQLWKLLPAGETASEISHSCAQSERDNL